MAIVCIVCLTKTNQSSRITARAIVSKHERSLGQLIRITVLHQGASEMINQGSYVSSLPKLTKIEEIRLPIPRKNLITALSV